MIFERIMLHNFGLYGGRHEIELEPPSPEQPVVLFGGLNGAGKTTLLDAIHLVLYGKRARCSNRGSLAYHDFLRECVHIAVDQRTGAALELTFRVRSDGEDQTFRVHRSWAVKGKALRERVEVVTNGRLDTVMTDRWDEEVERFLPQGIAHLFLFDGEKIENLADLENSTELLTSAIHSLLGLDLVEQLGADLTALERKKRLAMRPDADRAKIQQLNAELEKLKSRQGQVRQRAAAAQTVVDAKALDLTKLDRRFRRQGGNAFEQREALEIRRKQLERELRDRDDELREFAHSSTPLLLVRSLLAETAGQAKAEAHLKQARLLDGVLAARDESALALLTLQRVKAPTVRKLAKFLERDRRARRPSDDTREFLGIEPEAEESLQLLLSGGLDDSHAALSRLLGRRQELTEDLTDADRKLAAVPDEEAIRGLIEARREAQASLEQAVGVIRAEEAELERLSAEREQFETVITAEIEKAVSADFEREDISRLLAHSAKARQTLDRFRQAVLARHVDRIQLLVLESFRSLLRKQGLIRGLLIDPATLQLTLLGRDDQALDPNRLSAGERQLFAVSLLWGLARAAGRPLPTVIDTPLGRLDSKHRKHLVDRYFPHASHQVLLLSTDEEIDERHHRSLEESVGRSYRLVFDDESGSTRAEPGYFAFEEGA